MTFKGDPIDLQVGQRLRLRRTALGMSQERLGEAIGVSFQMVQKYERGDCRVSASRLMKVAQELQVPVSYFFEGIAKGKNLKVAEEKGQLDADVFEKKETIDLLKAYYALPEAARRGFLAMLKGMDK